MLEKPQRFRVERWATRLEGEPGVIGRWRRTRHLYTASLLNMLSFGLLLDPFDALPDDGPLANFPYPNVWTPPRRGGAKSRRVRRPPPHSPYVLRRARARPPSAARARPAGRPKRRRRRRKRPVGGSGSAGLAKVATSNGRVPPRIGGSRGAMGKANGGGGSRSPPPTTTAAESGWIAGGTGALLTGGGDRQNDTAKPDRRSDAKPVAAGIAPSSVGQPESTGGEEVAAPHRRPGQGVTGAGAGGLDASAAPVAPIPAAGLNKALVAPSPADSVADLLGWTSPAVEATTVASAPVAASSGPVVLGAGTAGPAATPPKPGPALVDLFPVSPSPSDVDLSRGDGGGGGNSGDSGALVAADGAPSDLSIAASPASPAESPALPAAPLLDLAPPPPLAAPLAATTLQPVKPVAAADAPATVATGVDATPPPLDLDDDLLATMNALVGTVTAQDAELNKKREQMKSSEVRARVCVCVCVCVFK